MQITLPSEIISDFTGNFDTSQMNLEAYCSFVERTKFRTLAYIDEILHRSIVKKYWNM